MPDLAFTLRDAAPDDAAALVAYMRVLADEPHNGTTYSSAAEFTFTEADERQLITDTTDDPLRKMIVAVSADDDIIGLVIAAAGSRVMHITADIALSVAKTHRRRGVGRALMVAVIDWARRHPTIKRLELSVFDNNPGAIALYEDLGFQHEGRKRRSALKHGERLDILIMGLLLD